jgi:atypical dual specificity phosphatase
MKKTILFVSVVFSFSHYFGYQALNAAGRVHQRNSAAALRKAKIITKKTNRYPQRLIKGLSWIQLNPRIGGMPFPENRADIHALYNQQNVGLIVTLTEDPLPNWYFHGEMYSINIHLPIAKNKAPSAVQLEYFLRKAQEAHDQGKAVVVHCDRGLGRTGTMLACWMIANERGMSFPGMTAEKVIQELRTRRPNSVSSSEQKKFIQYYLESMQRSLRKE